jgi:hypothetical protein
MNRYINLNENKTIKSARYRVWLMISTLAFLIAWIIGYAAEKQGLHHDFQAKLVKKDTFIIKTMIK